MIKLYFKTTEFVSPRYGEFLLTIIRLIANVRLVRRDGSLSKAFKAIVDTGAHSSVIPVSIWRGLKVDIKVKDANFGGINNRPECLIPASLGTARCLLTDETGALSPELEILSFLAKTDQVPLILGFADLLSKFEIIFDYESGKAFARSPSADRK